MKKDYSDIDIYNNSAIIYYRKNDIFIPFWITVLFVATFVFVLIACFYKYSLYDIYYGKVIINNEENYILLEVDENFILKKNRNFLNINNEDYKCELVDFSDKYYIFNEKKYWNVSYECEIPEEINVNNNIVKVKIDKRKTTLLKEIIIKIRKGQKND